jgi:serine protease Do
VVVREVNPDSPAAKAGIEPRDIITAVNGERVESWNDFVRDIVTKKVGDTVKMTIVRNGATKTLSVVLTERPAEPR